jgi:serine/threonine protein kinase
MDHENCLGILLTKKGTELYIIKPIGEGATSIVYLSTDKDKKEYAVKLYKNSESYSNEISRFRNLTQSKYIVKLISSGQGHLERGYSYNSYKLFNHFDSDKVYYGIFEYLKNGELHNYIFLLKKKLSEDISRKIFFDLLKVIETCHKCGITHGDIKLQNILFNSNFNIKLIDFGFAKNIKDGLIREITGTRFYNAPEMFSCATKGYDGISSDIFSLGVVLFILVMGFYPFDKPNITDSRYKYISKKDYPGFWKKCEQKMNINSSFTGVSYEFKDLFEKMVTYRPKERISINEIKKHPWLKDLFKNMDYDQDEKLDFDKDNINDKKKLIPIPKKKEKVKNLSHNPSFNKKDNNCSNDLETKSNHSDGFNNDKEDKNKLLSIYYKEEYDCEKENSQKNFLNNKAKEFEMKYFKELSLRKNTIDKILKEQEDDAD